MPSLPVFRFTPYGLLASRIRNRKLELPRPHSQAGEAVKVLNIWSTNLGLYSLDIKVSNIEIMKKDFYADFTKLSQSLELGNEQNGLMFLKR